MKKGQLRQNKMAVLTAQNGGLAIQELKPGTYCNKASFS
jgi:hypothetical protein